MSNSALGLKKGILVWQIHANLSTVRIIKTKLVQGHESDVWVNSGPVAALVYHNQHKDVKSFFSQNWKPVQSGKVNNRKLRYFKVWGGAH